MKYATAVYGDTMIQSVEADVLGIFYCEWSAVTRTRIGEHCSLLPPDDIILMDVDPDGDVRMCHSIPFVVF